jgi:hypothetical protein
MVEPSREVTRGLERDPSLRNRGRNEIGLGVLGRDQMVKRDQSGKSRLGIPSRKQDQRLAAPIEHRLRDLALERLQRVPDSVGDLQQTAISRVNTAF